MFKLYISTFVVVMLGGACSEMTAVRPKSDGASSSAEAEERVAGAEEGDSAGAALPLLRPRCGRTTSSCL